MTIRLPSDRATEFRTALCRSGFTAELRPAHSAGYSEILTDAQEPTIQIVARRISCTVGII